MTPIIIFTDDSYRYMTTYYPSGQSIQSVVEFVITEVQTHRMSRMELDFTEFYFSYGSNVIVLKFELGGTSWRIL